MVIRRVRRLEFVRTGWMDFAEAVWDGCCRGWCGKAGAGVVEDVVGKEAKEFGVAALVYHHQRKPNATPYGVPNITVLVSTNSTTIKRGYLSPNPNITLIEPARVVIVREAPSVSFHSAPPPASLATPHCPAVVPAPCSRPTFKPQPNLTCIIFNLIATLTRVYNPTYPDTQQAPNSLHG